MNVNPNSFVLVFFLEELSRKCDFFPNDSDIRLDGEIDENQLRSYITEIFAIIEGFK